MKALRRSIKGEKNESKFSHISITPKSAVAIVPPKAVIRALYDYEAQSTQELGFQKGDFFHVIGRENDQDWYEACNPAIPDKRGLVPAQYFQRLGKTERDSGQSTGSADSQPAHDSGYADGNGITSPLPPPTPTTSGQKSPLASRMSTGGKRAMGSVLARLDHPFEADNSRPEHDEISRDVGDMVLIVAVSTAEWVVAKPAGPKGGGHGLLPLGFVTLLDMKTHAPLGGDPLEIIRREAVPPVDVWKQATAAYKNSCIELGKIGPSGAQQQTGDLQQSMERMSLQQQQQGFMRNSGQPQTGYRESELAQQAGNVLFFKDPGQEEATERAQKFPLRLQMQNYARHFSPPSSACIYASVISVQTQQDDHVFTLNVAFEDGNEFELQRVYENFFKFQVLLKDAFPAEAGVIEGKDRSLPYMPGPLPARAVLTEDISRKRCEGLDEYVSKLLQQPNHIARSVLVTIFFSPQHQLDRFLGKAPPAPQQNGGYQTEPQRSSYGVRDMSGSRQSSRGEMNGTYSGMNFPMGQNFPQANGYGIGSGNPYAQDDRQTSSISQPSNHSSQDVSQQPIPSAMKVKVHFGEDLFAIRVPTEILFQQLYDKICDRLKIPDGDEVNMYYKDEPSGEKPGLMSNNDLDVALQRNDKLVVYVEPA